MEMSRHDMAKHEINFLNDDPSTMTLSRRVALYLMKRYKWYNPQLREQQRCDPCQDEGDESGVSSYNYVEMDEISNDGSFNKSMLRSPLQPERPSLEKAWAYFEHVTLPRYLDHKSAKPKEAGPNTNLQQEDTSAPNVLLSSHDNTYDDNLRNEYCFEDADFHSRDELLDFAEPGEDSYPTKLYSPFWTPVNQMGDFGLGVGLYFSALRSIMMLTFIAGIINIPNMIYFASDKYSHGQEGVDVLIRGSAVCTLEEFVPCPSCNLEDFADVPHRIATIYSVYNDEYLIFVLKNNCDGAKLPLAFVNFATLLVLMYGLLRINHHLKEQEIKFDEDEQTAQDYSIVVKNPPIDAIEPDEWKDFFDTKFGPDIHVTCCTIARDNYLLVRALVLRREILQKLKWKLPPGTELDIASLAVIVNDLKEKRTALTRMKSMMTQDIPELFIQLNRINAEVKKLASVDFPVTRVFVTFETEKAQRHILRQLSVGSKAIRKCDKLNIDNPDHLFALHVKEAPEPSTIRWHDLSDQHWERSIRYLLTTYAWACAMIFVVFIVRLCYHRSAKFAAYAIAFAFPEFAKLLVNFESHPSEGRLQRSLYIKIGAFRWINTAIIVTLVTPFPSTIGSRADDLIDGIRDIFVAEIVASNLIKLVDPKGFIKRHYLAPRAQSQEEMNSHMRGDEWYLAERFTNMTKLVFLTLWYSSIYPFGFFLCSFALLINYFADRYSLMRTWRRAPSLGSSISNFTRRYFFTLVVSAMAVACSYSWAGFPYDNLCINNDDEGINYELGYYIGNWSVVSVDGSLRSDVSVSAGDVSYRFCQQSLYWYGKGFNFPAIPSWQKEGEEWMSNEQKLLTSLYGWSSFVLVLCTLLWITSISVRTFIYRANYEACGKDQGIPFSDVAAISSYIPEVRSGIFSYPLLAVDTDHVDEELYEWKDPDKPHSYYDLTRDARQILKDVRSEGEIRSLFSKVKCWRPNSGVPCGAIAETKARSSDSQAYDR
ncbi:hypothetical protein HJC23_009665 [Cyclotella cryptica]|uniref:CSC1/OSCA1-like cytosolic domain-containing protein n=1 Tax=Cyclotella cryptica TaxID=29204 RepID=A0ABD3NKX4_9STRA